MTDKIYVNRETFEDAVVKRAKAVLGLRGVRHANKVRVCINPAREYNGPLVESAIADVAKEVADETQARSLEYTS